MKLAAYLELTKPRVTLLVVFTSGVAFYVASAGAVNLGLLFHSLLGVALVSAGTAVLNQFLEREADGRMKRTCGRPLPSGRLQAKGALILGSSLVAGGTFYLAGFSNFLAAALAAATSAVYLFVYTPLKARTPICTTIGAIPGALPPLIGWAAARGELDLQGWLLFGILFAWQFPHFLAISWIYREDYMRGGFAMLSAIDPDGKRTGRQVLGSTVLLLCLSAGPWISGLAGAIYLAGAVLLGAVLIWLGLGLARSCSVTAARHVLRASVVYLPLLLVLMVIDKT